MGHHFYDDHTHHHHHDTAEGHHAHELPSLDPLYYGEQTIVWLADTNQSVVQPHHAIPGEAHYAHFNPTYHGPGIIGTPAEDMTFWHQQLHDTTCAVASQEFILDSFGLYLSENELRNEATDHGWYTPHGGTPEASVGDLLTLHGIPVERHYGATIQELADRLSHGQKLIASVDAEDIWFHGTPGDPLNQYPGIPGQHADHAVEVIGINTSDPAHPSVVLNDPGLADGEGILVPLDIFEQAWSASQHFLVASGPGTAPSTEHSADGVLLRGYANADGTYHWDSDNTDTDPVTGAVVRRW